MYLYFAYIAVLVAAVFFFLLTQVVIPLKKGTKLFPFFQKDRHLSYLRDEKNRELEQLAEKIEITKLEKDINRRKAELEKK